MKENGHKIRPLPKLFHPEEYNVLDALREDDGIIFEK